MARFQIIVLIVAINFQFFLTKEIGLSSLPPIKQTQGVTDPVLVDGSKMDGNLSLLLNQNGGVDVSTIGAFYNTLPGGHNVGGFLQALAAGQNHAAGLHNGGNGGNTGGGMGMGSGSTNSSSALSQFFGLGQNNGPNAGFSMNGSGSQNGGFFNFMGQGGQGQGGNGGNKPMGAG